MKLFGKLRRNRKAVTTVESVIIVVLIIAIILSAGTLYYVSTVTRQLAELSTGISKLSDSVSKLSGDLATVSTTVEDIREILGRPPTTPPTPTPPPTPKYKETLIIGTTDSVEKTIDPAQAYDWFGWHILQQIALTLVEVEPGSEAGPEDYFPALATDWSVSADLKTWTFNLRKGVKFEDGREVTAEDVKYSIDRAIALIPEIPEGAPAGLGYDLVIDSVEVSDTYQVKFHLKIPFAAFLGFMGCRSSAIVNRDYAPIKEIEYTEGDVRASTPVGFLGPYKLTMWVRIAGRDTEMRLEANPNYWNAAVYPKTKNIVYKFYADPTALRLAIEAGDIDIAFRHLRSADVIDLTKNPNLKVWWGVGAAIQYMIFQEKIEPFGDARVRRALAAALDRPTLTSTVFLGLTEPLYSIIPKGMLGHTEAFKELGDANYELTRNLLAELGYNEDNKLQVELWYESSGHYPMSAEQAVVYKDSFEKSGVITVTIKSADWASYKLNRDNEIMPVYVYGWYPDYVDPDNYAFLYWAAWLHHNYENPDIVVLYDQARAITDPTERARLYAEIDKIAVRDSPVVPLWQGVAYAVTKPDVEGLVLDITQDMRYWLVYAEIPA